MSDIALSNPFYFSMPVESSAIKKSVVFQVGLLHAAIALLLLNSWAPTQQSPLAVKTINIQMFTMPIVQPKPVEPPPPIVERTPLVEIKPKPIIKAPVIKQDFAFERVKEEEPKPLVKPEPIKPKVKKIIVQKQPQAKPEIVQKQPIHKVVEKQTNQVRLNKTATNDKSKPASTNTASNTSAIKDTVALSNQQYLPIEKKAPAYPKGALRKSLEGNCIVRYTVNSKGHVESPEILGDCHPLFKRTSLAAAKQFRYEPRIINGKAVAVLNVKNTFEYRIQ